MVYYEETNSVNNAIVREKQLKKWNRIWKLKLIEKLNPNWIDFSKSWIPDQVGDDLITKKGGNIAGTARKQIEKRSGKKVLTGKNARSLKLV